MTLPILFGIAGTLVLFAVLASLVWGKRPDDYLDPYGQEFDDEIVEVDTLVGLGAKVGAVNRANGWRTHATPDAAWNANPYYVPAVLMLIVSEAAEALEAYRKDDRANFNEEVADMLIRVLDLADLLDIDLDDETYRKLSKNATRGYRHGGKRV